MANAPRAPMSDNSDRRRERLVVLALAGVLALNYPLLQLFDEARLVLGIPLLYLYLFCVWVGLIGLGAWILEGRSPPAGHGDGTDREHRPR